MKKFLALLLALVMALSLVACGQTGTDDPGTGGDETPGIEVPEGRIAVRYWCPHGESTSKRLDEIAINKFNESQDKYWIVREFNGGYYDMLAKMQVTAKEDLPAFINSSSETVGSYLHSGLILPIQDFIDADPNYVDPNLYKNLIATYGLNGELVGYPMSFSLSGFFYNKAVFEAAGIDPYSLTNMDAITDAVKVICDGGHAKYGIAEEHSGIWANYAFHREGFFTVDNNNAADGLPTKCLYDDNSNGFADIVKGYYQNWADIAAGGYLYPFGASMGEELIPAVGTGDLAMLVTTNSYQARMNDAFGGNNQGYGFVPMFSATANGKNTGYCSSGQGFFMVDNGNAEEQAGAWEFMKFWQNDVDVQMAWLQATGYLPLSEAITVSDEYQAYLATYPYVEKIIEAIKTSDLSAYYAFTATNNEYSPAGATCLEAVINGTPVEEAIAQMCQTINDSFTMYNATNKS